MPASTQPERGRRGPRACGRSGDTRQGAHERSGAVGRQARQRSGSALRAGECVSGAEWRGAAEDEGHAAAVGEHTSASADRRAHGQIRTDGRSGGPVERHGAVRPSTSTARRAGARPARTVRHRAGAAGVSEQGGAA
jgi:hypothetical protein